MNAKLMPYPDSDLFLFRFEGLQGTYSLLLSLEDVEALKLSVDKALAMSFLEAEAA